MLQLKKVKTVRQLGNWRVHHREGRCGWARWVSGRRCGIKSERLEKIKCDCMPRPYIWILFWGSQKPLEDESRGMTWFTFLKSSEKNWLQRQVPVKTGSRVAVEEGSFDEWNVVVDTYCDSENVNFLKTHRFLITLSFCGFYFNQ